MLFRLSVEIKQAAATFAPAGDAYTQVEMLMESATKRLSKTSWTKCSEKAAVAHEVFPFAKGLFRFIA